MRRAVGLRRHRCHSSHCLPGGVTGFVVVESNNAKGGTCRLPMRGASDGRHLPRRSEQRLLGLGAAYRCGGKLLRILVTLLATLSSDGLVLVNAPSPTPRQTSCRL